MIKIWYLYSQMASNKSTMAKHCATSSYKLVLLQQNVSVSACLVEMSVQVSWDLIHSQAEWWKASWYLQHPCCTTNPPAAEFHLSPQYSFQYSAAKGGPLGESLFRTTLSMNDANKTYLSCQVLKKRTLGRVPVLNHTVYERQCGSTTYPAKSWIYWTSSDRIPNTQSPTHSWTLFSWFIGEIYHIAHGTLASPTHHTIFYPCFIHEPHRFIPDQTLPYPTHYIPLFSLFSQWIISPPPPPLLFLLLLPS